MEATFRPELLFELGPFDLIVLGEGERPLLELVARLREGRPLGGIPGTAERTRDGQDPFDPATGAGPRGAA